MVGLMLLERRTARAVSGPFPTCCCPGIPWPGRPLGNMTVWLGLNGAPPSRRGLLDGEGAFSAPPGEAGLTRFPSMSEGSRCIWPAAFC